METNQENEVQRHIFLRSVMDTVEWPQAHTHTHLSDSFTPGKERPATTDRRTGYVSGLFLAYWRK